MRSALVVFAFVLLAHAPAHAQQRTITIEMTPTIRTQLAIWIESADHAIFQTIRLTDAVAFRGLGNRPGALQMNSGYHWPYGRREGVLPIWAHRRASATGLVWHRVIFAGRTSEGDASRAGVYEAANTPDPYYCLSFTGHETLDAVSCASVFMSNKGRFVTAADTSAAYAEPFEDSPGVGRMRPLDTDSFYPPRGDVACDHGCPDTADVTTYVSERARVMPELDAVTMATPPHDALFSFTYDVPEAWPDGDYTVFVEANTEGDYARPTWYSPTPMTPHEEWDWYAINDGYPYRGQPSVLYSVAVHVGMQPGDGMFTTAVPVGHGDIHGASGDATSMDGSGIVDDPVMFPGSGADRLRMGADGSRVRVSVPVIDPCQGPNPPAECSRQCTNDGGCADGFLCGADGQCVGRCTIAMAPAVPSDLASAPVEDIHHSHQWAHFSFVVPASTRGIQSYEVRVGTEPITDATSFAAARPAKAATLEDEALVVPTTAAAGETITVDLGGLSPTTTYYVGVRAFDDCNASSDVAATEVTTTAIHFTTVSPCFVATAAYGTPLDARIGVLRRFRDRWLMSNDLGRAWVAAYYEIGPRAAAWIAQSEERRSVARALIDPIVSLLE